MFKVVFEGIRNTTLRCHWKGELMLPSTRFEVYLIASVIGFDYETYDHFAEHDAKVLRMTLTNGKRLLTFAVWPSATASGAAGNIGKRFKNMKNWTGFFSCSSGTALFTACLIFLVSPLLVSIPVAKLPDSPPEVRNSRLRLQAVLEEVLEENVRLPGWPWVLLFGGVG